MGLFSAIVKTTINVATLPVALAKDTLTLGGTLTEKDKTYTEKKLEQIKKEAE